MNQGDVARNRIESTAESEQRALVALLGRIARYDEGALAQFYDATVAKAYALACRITRDPRAAEEVVLDVYFQVWQQAQRYDSSRGSVLAWLVTVCRSRAIDYLRRRDPIELHAAPYDLRPDLFANHEGPPDLLSAIEQSSRLHAALMHLNERQRYLISLAYFEGLTHNEIARRTGIPLGSVKSALRRSLQTLHQALLAPDEPPGLDRRNRHS